MALFYPTLVKSKGFKSTEHLIEANGHIINLESYIVSCPNITILSPNSHIQLTLWLNNMLQPTETTST